MLVWDVPDGPQNIPLRGCAPAGDGVWSAYGGCLYACYKIIQRHTLECVEFEPTKLSMAMIGAFQAMGGRVAQCDETSYAQWKQFVVCASQAVARRSLADWVRPILAASVTAVRRVKAFFVAQKVNGRNAP